VRRGGGPALAEHYTFGERSVGLREAVAQRDPHPINFSWRDYGARVGIWRTAELFRPPRAQ